LLKPNPLSIILISLNQYIKQSKSQPSVRWAYKAELEVGKISADIRAVKLRH